MSELDLMICVDTFLALIIAADLIKSIIDEDIRSVAESLDYQKAVEDTEYCEQYEPTYNSDDGSM